MINLRLVSKIRLFSCLSRCDTFHGIQESKASSHSAVVSSGQGCNTSGEHKATHHLGFTLPDTVMEKNDTKYSVQLYIYDLSRGMARSLSPIMLGKQLDGIWHTAIVVYGDEFFFGGVGISSCSPGGTMLGPPDTVVELGDTEVSEEIFMDYLSSLGESAYRGDRYRLFEHNCNTFTNEVAQFLTGRNIPSYITDLPSEVLSTPFGQILRPILDSIHIAPPGGNVINGRHS